MREEFIEIFSPPIDELPLAFALKFSEVGISNI